MFRNSKGFTFTEIVIAMGAVSILAVATAYTLIDVKTAANKTSDRSEVERTHYVALQRARNLSFLSSAMGLTNQAGERADAALDECLSGRGTGCQSKKKKVELAGGSSILKSSAGREIKSVMTADISCLTAVACEKVTITIRTQDIGSDGLTPSQGTHGQGGDYGGSPRGNENATAQGDGRLKLTATDYPGAAFAPISQIAFDCSNSGGQILRSVDLTDRTTSCSWLLSTGGTECSTRGPMGKFGSQLTCQNLENKDCPTGESNAGIGRVGIFVDDTVCRTVASDTGGGPPPVPPATPPPTATPVATATPVPTATPVASTCTRGTQTYAVGAVTGWKTIRRAGALFSGSFGWGNSGYDRVEVMYQCDVGNAIVPYCVGQTTGWGSDCADFITRALAEPALAGDNMTHDCKCGRYSSPCDPTYGHCS